MTATTLADETAVELFEALREMNQTLRMLVTYLDPPAESRRVTPRTAALRLVVDNTCDVPDDS